MNPLRSDIPFHLAVPVVYPHFPSISECGTQIGVHERRWVGDYVFEAEFVTCAECMQTDAYRNKLLEKELTK